ncbi:hypothetical protein SAMN05216360_11166 [Methylobacterium phyllostachyos]|uniref:Uncharacterized protein n=1 Tax=Methylobacterium phyllostachyos TaxID=582672 RepID=A0A1H0E693_9HYPH|nr:hypothetical protein [Methylobacterium phyllostachyos]SDN77865.1 hypothetical protein SAMN05216360_11166 [Methylobacterium phyllostachyos]
MTGSRPIRDIQDLRENRTGNNLSDWRIRKIVLAFVDAFDRDSPAVPSTEIVNRDASVGLALDMVGRAYLALALLYETAHPGEFDDAQHKIRAFVADNFRINEETSRSGTLDAGTVEAATHLVNSILTEAENRIATMIRPSRHLRGQMAT